MKDLLLSILLILFCTSILGQDDKVLSFDIGYGFNSYKMEDLNTYYIDSLAAKPENDLLRNYVEKGEYFRIGVNYKPVNWVEFGLNANYQFSSLKSSPWEEYFDSEIGQEVFNKSYYELRTEVIGIGFGATLFFSECFKSQENYIKITRLGLEMIGGLSFTKVSTIHLVKTFQTFDRTNMYYAKETFQSQIGLKAEYDFTTTPIITSLGLRAGYQFLKTGVVRDAANQEWNVNDQYPITLDFSGVYFGVYLKIGK